MKNNDEKIVFVVDHRSLDINCAYLISEPCASEKMVKMKHRARAFAVPSMLCHATIDAAKAALLKHLQFCAKNVQELEYDAENFLVS